MVIQNSSKDTIMGRDPTAEYIARGGYRPSHIVWRNIFRSSLLISMTLVSNDPCRVRALHRSFASRNARPNSL